MRGYYLAHATRDRFYVRDNFQRTLEEQGIKIINPFMLDPNTERIFYDPDNKDNLVEALKKEQGLRRPEDIVREEMGHIVDANGLIAHIAQESLGTSMEIFLNSEYLRRGRRGTIAYINSELCKQNGVDPDYLRNHVWLNTFTTVCDSVDEVVANVWHNQKSMRGYDERNV